MVCAMRSLQLGVVCITTIMMIANGGKHPPHLSEDPSNAFTMFQQMFHRRYANTGEEQRRKVIPCHISHAYI
jgi:hypothetical protein